MIKYFYTISSIVATLPWIKQFIELDIFPYYWDKGNIVINIVISLLCFLLTALLYGLKNRIKNIAKRTLIISTLSLFILFTFSIINYFALYSKTNIQVDDCCTLDKNFKCITQNVFLPRCLPSDIYDYESNKLIIDAEYPISFNYDPCAIQDSLFASTYVFVLKCYERTYLLLGINYLLIFVFLLTCVLIPVIYFSENSSS